MRTYAGRTRGPLRIDERLHISAREQFDQPVDRDAYRYSDCTREQSQELFQRGYRRTDRILRGRFLRERIGRTVRDMARPEQPEKRDGTDTDASRPSYSINRRYAARRRRVRLSYERHRGAAYRQADFRTQTRRFVLLYRAQKTLCGKPFRRDLRTAVGQQPPYILIYGR